MNLRRSALSPLFLLSLFIVAGCGSGGHATSQSPAIVATVPASRQADQAYAGAQGDVSNDLMQGISKIVDARMSLAANDVGTAQSDFQAAKGYFRQGLATLDRHHPTPKYAQLDREMRLTLIGYVAGSDQLLAYLKNHGTQKAFNSFSSAFKSATDHMAKAERIIAKLRHKTQP